MEKQQEFQELVQEFKTCMMTTVGRDGMLHSRPMGTQDPLEDSPLWFAAALDSAKVEDMKADPRVNLAYYRPKDAAWVSVGGKARLEQDRAKIEKLWDESWRPWFPDGPEQDGLVLIHVEPEIITYWKSGMGKIGYLMAAAKAYVTGTTPDVKPPTTIHA